MDPRNGPRASFPRYIMAMPRTTCSRVYAFALSIPFLVYRSNEENPLSLPPSAASTPSTAMPRRSGGRSAPRAAPRPAPARSPPPAPANHAPPPAPAQGGGGSMLSGIGSTIAQGMAFGTGSAVAHRAVDSVLGPRTIQHETVVAAAPEATTNSVGGADACNLHSKAFQDCVNNFGSDISKCQFYMDMLAECRKNNGSMLGA